MLCSRLYCQKGFNLNPFSYEIQELKSLRRRSGAHAKPFEFSKIIFLSQKSFHSRFLETRRKFSPNNDKWLQERTFVSNSDPWDTPTKGLLWTPLSYEQGTPAPARPNVRTGHVLHVVYHARPFWGYSNVNFQISFRQSWHFSAKS